VADERSAGPTPEGTPAFAREIGAYVVRGFYSDDQELARVEVVRDGVVLRAFPVQAYALWNYEAHAEELLPLCWRCGKETDAGPSEDFVCPRCYGELYLDRGGL
jgi:hypothetical protein